MASIQLALSDAPRCDALRAMLVRSTDVPVICVDKPQLESACVVVMDGTRFAELPVPITHPERVVLITRQEAGRLREAWEAGVNSVLSEQDPLDTVVLAVLAACLRVKASSARLAVERPG